MALLESLLDAIVRLDGDSLVMHVGEKPYVVTTSSALSALRGPLCWGQVELSSRPLTADAVLAMLGHILPEEQRRLLEEVGAVEHEILSGASPGQPFILTAARGGDDIWVEVRRKPEIIGLESPVEEPPAAIDVTPEPDAAPPMAEEPAIHFVHPDVHEIEVPPNFEWAPGEAAPRIVAASAGPIIEPAEPERMPDLSEQELILTPGNSEPVIELVEPALGIAEPEHVVEWEPEPVAASDRPAPADELPEPDIALTEGEPIVDLTEPPLVEATEPEPVVHLAASELTEPERAIEFERPAPEPIVDFAQLPKPSLKLQPPPIAPAPAASTEASLVGLLKAAAARGASMVYAVADSRPMMRLDGEIAVLGIEAAVTGTDVDRFTFEFAPRDQVAESTPEWTCAVKGVGRVRCVTFRDDSGAGLIFHLPSPNVSTADELGLSPRIQALSGEADGLIVIAGPRGSGKSTMLDVFVDLINRTRNDHVITIESHIRTAHAKRYSFISQRQSAPDGEAIAAAARAALREGPDVLVIEDLRAPEAVSVALDAARSGRLVFGGIAAPTASAAVERLIGAYPADRRPQMRALLAGSLRAVVAQVLVRKPNGGRIGARELLLNIPAVEKLILDGATGQLPIAIDGGRRLGMVTMNDALGTLVRDGVVEVIEACRCAPDRSSLIAALERDGIDVSNVERWA